MKILIIIFSFVIFGCNNTEKFYSSQEVIFNGKRLEIGDILIKEKNGNFLSWWGHSSIIVGENKIGDLPKLREKYYETSIENWVEKNRKVMVLRYKKIDKNFQNKLLENIKKYKNKPYKIFLTKESENGFYCSKFIWFIYKKTAEEFGEELDIDSNKGWIIFPYDFIDSKNLKKINLYKIKGRD